MRLLTMVFSVLSVLLTVLAGPYRVIAYRFRSFGGIGAGLVTWAGIVFGYPLCVAAWPPPEDAGPALLMLWLGLFLVAWVQMFAKWCSVKPPRDEGSGHFWAGRGELVFVLAISWLAASYCSVGSGVFLLAGYVASVMQVWLVRLRRRCEAWTPADTARVVSPVRNGVAWVRVAIPAMAFAVLTFTQPMIPIALNVAQGAWGMMRRRMTAAVVQTPDGQAVYAPPTFMGRVGSYLTAHMVLSVISGIIGFKVIGLIFAIPLWIMGWDPHPPKAVKEEGRAVMSRIWESLDDKKDEALDRLRDRREEVTERFDAKRDEVAEDLHRKKNQAMRKYLFGW